MDKQLQTISWRLHALSSTLSRQPQIQFTIKRMSTKTKNAAESLQHTLQIKGGSILDQKMLITSAINNEGALEDMRTTFKSFHDGIDTTKTTIISIQTDISDYIDVCFSLKTSLEIDCDDLLSKISKVNEKIDKIGVNLARYKKKADGKSTEAFYVNERAGLKRKASEERIRSAKLTGMVGAIVGVALCPFTNGTSLTMAQAATHLNDISDETQGLLEKADNLRCEADSHFRDARYLRENISKHKRKRSSLHDKLGHIRTSIDGVTEAYIVLKQVSSFLIPTFNTIDSLLSTLHTLEKALEEACDNEKPTYLVRSALVRNPEMFQTCPQAKFLADKWKQLEDLLIRNGVQG